MIVMNTIRKRMPLFVVILLVSMILLLPAYADRTKYLKPSASDLSKAELKEIAAEFFSVKWGIPKEDILKAKAIIQLIDDKIPHWEVHLYACPGTDGHGVGSIGIYRDGTLFWWEIRAWPRYYEAEPDLMAMGTIITPTEADATSQEIYERTMERLKNDYHVDEPERYT